MPPELKPVVKFLWSIATCTFVAIVIAVLMAACTPEPALPLDPETKRWRSYTMDSLRVYEWRDDWGRVCTWTHLNGGRDQALDCDWPQLNTP